MSVKYGKFELPQEIEVDTESETNIYARFIAEPFERGFGHTIGNAMRRMMLSALEAPAIVSLRIEGAPHEYMAIDGVVEDMINIVLNFKGALLRSSIEHAGSHALHNLSKTLDVTREDLDRNQGQVLVTLGDVVEPGYFEVVNPELHLFTVTKPFKRQIDLRVGLGRGYVPSERHIVRDKTSDEILLDAAFSPIRLVNYFVENTRVGQDTDLDRLILDVYTDGRITPREALGFAAQIGQRHFDVFTKDRAHPIHFDEGLSERNADLDEMMDKLSLRIDEIELSVRSTNCLSGANIDTIAELVSIPERRMLEFRNFGKKSLNEIKAKLTDMELSLGMDLSAYGLTQDNVKEKVRQYNEERKGRKEKYKQKVTTLIEDSFDDEEDDEE